LSNGALFGGSGALLFEGGGGLAWLLLSQSSDKRVNACSADEETTDRNQ